MDRVSNVGVHSDSPQAVQNNVRQLDPHAMAKRGRIGGFMQRATNDPKEYTANARKTFNNGFLEKIVAQFPDLPETEQAARADALRRAHFSKLALKSASIRKANAARRASQTKGGATA